MDSNNQIVELMAPLTISSNILLDDERSVVVYTDGAFFPNERLMGIGVWFGVHITFFDGEINFQMSAPPPRNQAPPDSEHGTWERQPSRGGDRNRGSGRDRGGGGGSRRGGGGSR